VEVAAAEAPVPARAKVKTTVPKTGAAQGNVPGMVRVLAQDLLVVPAAGPGTRMVRVAKETEAGRVIGKGQ
jgi:hypothetical protein